MVRLVWAVIKIVKANAMVIKKEIVVGFVEGLVILALLRLVTGKTSVIVKVNVVVQL
jgi:hypothetical protein